MTSSVFSAEDPEDFLHHDDPGDDEAGIFVLPHWTAKRHLTGGNPKVLRPLEDGDEEERDESEAGGAQAVPLTAQKRDWRPKSRLKTHGAALVICLNIAVDPPDVVKPKPCAKLECWVDPANYRPDKALEEIGKNLQRQFETLSQKVRYKLYLDPALEDTKKLCHQLRKTAKDERVLFYYNGHGVPAPTASGEIWVFNRNYTQYMPVSLYDLQEWLGSPCIFVWDCSAAGNIINNFNRLAKQRDEETAKQPSPPNGVDPSPSPAPMRDCIQLAACGPHETLPMNPDLPADLFTSCLTSPIEIALRFFVLQDPLRTRGPNDAPRPRATVDMVMRIPGDLKDRRTPLGELNWIFTSVTDTIAWLVFPQDLFRRLFRQDLLVAALFRNFLLAERIMRTYGCTPRSEPPLPATYHHPLWDSWDLTVEACLAQLPDLLRAEASARDPMLPPFQYKYQPSNFYVEHLTALQLWLQNSGAVSRPLSKGPASALHPSRRPPQQLPIVLQVLLSQAHRLRALILVSKFVDLGPWAVHQALEIGIFPYVQRLLQSPAQELRPVLIFIWSRILAVDKSCQPDLLKDNGYAYFAAILASHPPDQPNQIPNASEHCAMCAFILAVFCRDFRAGQQACLASNIFESCLRTMNDDDYLLRQWGPLCIAQLWDNNDEAKSVGIQLGAPGALCALLQDNSVEVRAAVLYALGTLFGASGSANPDAKGGGGSGVQLNRSAREQFHTEISFSTNAVLATAGDASPLVRKELIIMLSPIVREWRGWFVAAAWVYWEEEHRTQEKWEKLGPKGYVNRALQGWAEIPRSSEDFEGSIQEDQMVLSNVSTIFTALLEMSVDPYPEVATLACTVVDYITALLLESAFMVAEGSSIRPNLFGPTRPARPAPVQRAQTALSRSRPSSTGSPVDSSTDPYAADQTSFLFPSTALPPQLQRTRTENIPSPKETLKRSSSFATRLMTMTGLATPTSSPPPNHVDITSAPEPTPAASPYETATYQAPYALPQSQASPTSLTSSNSIPRASAVSTPPGGGATGPGWSSTSSLPLRTPGAGSTPVLEYPPCTAAQVIHALVEEDRERLSIRRHRGAEAGGSWSSGRTGPEGGLGIGMVAREVRDDVLPLKSKFFDWSCEYYTEPQMRQSEADEPGSVKYNEQLWRRERNEQIEIEAAIASEKISQDIQMRVLKGKKTITKHPWNDKVSQFTNDSWPMKMAFHSYEDHIAISDENDSISIWDWRDKTRLHRFANGVNSGTITSMYFINEVSEAILLTGTSEGNVRLWRKYESANELEIASAFRAVTTTTPSSQPAGLITDWNQQAGHLYISGDTTYVRIWDAHRELPHADIPTQADSCATTLSVELDDGGTIFAAGFGDGSVRVYDKRMPSEDAVVETYRKHRHWVQDVKVQQSGNVLVSGSLSGDVCVWDFRHGSEPLSETKVEPLGLSALSTHTSAPFAASLSTPLIDPVTHRKTTHLQIHHLGSTSGRVVTPRAVTDHYIPIASTASEARAGKRRFAPWMNALTFHPKEMFVGVGGIDNVVRIWGPEFDKWQATTEV